MNWEDPKVLKAMTDGSEKGLKLWKKTFGFDWAFWLRAHKEKIEKKSFEQIINNCVIEEKYQNFARDCKKSGGFFKCCGK